MKEDYEELQRTSDRIPKDNPLILMGDLNARIGNEGITQRFNEEIINNNGELINSFCFYKELCINNIFFNQKKKS